MVSDQFQPMSVTRIIDRVFFFYRKNFLKFMTLISLIMVPMGILSVFGTIAILRGSIDNSQIPMVTGALAGFIALFGTLLCSASLAYAFSKQYLNEEFTTGEVLGAVCPKLFRLVIATIVSSLIVFVGYLLFVVPGIIFALWYSMISVVIVLEGQGALKSLGRSKSLTKGNLGKVFGTLFLANIVAGGLSFSIAFGLSFLFAKIGLIEATILETTGSFSTKTMIFQQLSETIANILTFPISAGAIVMLYYDLRIRKEGFDLEMLARDMGGDYGYETAPEADNNY